MIGATLLVAVALAGAGIDDAAATTDTEVVPAVVLLPLLAEGTATPTQAFGTSARLRERLQSDGYVKLLSAGRDDMAAAERCRAEGGGDVRCFGKLAALRGADVLAGGTLFPVEDGLKVRLVAVQPNGTVADKRVEITLKGDSTDARRIDRLLRQTFRPDRLRGQVQVTGDDGAALFLDGVPVGTTPLSRPIGDVLEGAHELRAHKEGFTDIVRAVTVVHDDISPVEVRLTEPVNGAQVRTDALRAVPRDAWILGGLSGALGVAGVVCGVLSWRDSADVEARAAEKQLVFPRDSGLLLRGRILALTADGLYLATVASLLGGAALSLAAPPPEDAAAAASPVQPAVGAP